MSEGEESKTQGQGKKRKAQDVSIDQVDENRLDYQKHRCKDLKEQLKKLEDGKYRPLCMILNTKRPERCSGKNRDIITKSSRHNFLLGITMNKICNYTLTNLRDY